MLIAQIIALKINKLQRFDVFKALAFGTLMTEYAIRHRLQILSLCQITILDQETAESSGFGNAIAQGLVALLA